MRFSVVALLAVSIGTCSAQPVELEVGFDRTGRVEWVTGGVGVILVYPFNKPLMVDISLQVTQNHMETVVRMSG